MEVGWENRWIAGGKLVGMCSSWSAITV